MATTSELAERLYESWRSYQDLHDPQPYSNWPESQGRHAPRPRWDRLAPGEQAVWLHMAEQWVRVPA